MGSVKIETYKAEISWKNVNLSTPESIKGLLKFRRRFEYDIIYNKMFTFDMYLKENNYEILCLYIWLDDMMSRCKFTERQNKILEYYQEECTEEEIADILECTSENVYQNLKTIVKKIQKQVNLNYKYDFAEWDKVKTKTNWKKCSKCKEFKPQTKEFFSPDDRKPDGLRYVCKICDTGTKNP